VGRGQGAERNERTVARKVNLRLVGRPLVDRLLQPIHWWVWSDPNRRAHKLLGFSATEADSGRDMAQAAESTNDGVLRRLYIRHALDEQKHSNWFTSRARAILGSLDGNGARSAFQGNWFSPGERGLDDLDVTKESQASLLAFLFLSERKGARRFLVYKDVLGADPETRALFDEVIPDEAFHTNYTYAQLRRVSPKAYWLHILWAQLGILWKAYLRLASAIAGVMGAVVLTVQYFTVLPLFAFLAKRSAKRELPGWTPSRAPEASPLGAQY
jgi:hypothetical protein